jgi:8-oxo-dGTP pyrophosphatase MutT (NUDIX family)
VNGDAAGRFRHLDDEVIHRGHIITVCRSTFEAPDGSRFERDVVRHPGAVCVVPVDADGSVVLVRQYRAPLDTLLLELPAGRRDVDGEPPEVTAQRELAEEVGLRARRIEFLVRFHNSVGFCDEECLVFLGTELEAAELDRQGVEEEHMEVVRFPLTEAPARIAAGEITDGKTVIGLTLALAALS